MNHDLIIKLAKLANNNPNENEANLAARKVCKLLAEANFNFGTNTQYTPPPPPKNRDMRDDAFWEIFQRMQREPHRNPFYDRGWTNEGNRTRTEPPPSTRRTCSECGKSFLTNDPSLYYICNECVSKQNKQVYEDRYKAKYEKHIHQCQCGARNWWYDETRASWLCKKCKAIVSLEHAANNNWIMQ